MAFGQQSGPPASSKQLSYLLSLIKAAGHEGFRDARGPLALTQRQAAGKFTIGEASALIDQLVNGEVGDPDASSPPALAGRPDAAAERHEDRQATMLRGVPAHLLVSELERRGYHVRDPDEPC
ncbi:MAG: hypothetical protein ABIQ39_05665 [Ilumatobacteraceae bacterium]